MYILFLFFKLVKTHSQKYAKIEKHAHYSMYGLFPYDFYLPFTFPFSNVFTHILLSINILPLILIS